MNPMKTVRIEKLTLNIGAGKEPVRLEKGVALLKRITGIEPQKTVTQKRIPSWGVRPGLPIGCRLTLRKDKALELIKRLLAAKDNKLKMSQIDSLGNISFGIHEYIDIPGVEYDPGIGVMGLQVCITLERPGYRVKRRHIRPGSMHKSHLVTREDAIKFMEKEFKITVGESA